MKTILSALVALSFVAGVVAPASAAEFFSIKQLDQDRPRRPPRRLKLSRIVEQ